MAFKPLKLLKGGLEIVSTILPGGGLIKGVLNLAAKKIPGAEKVLEQVFTEAESLYRDKAEIREAYLQEQESEREYLLESEGKYSELSKTEKVWRSFLRPAPGRYPPRDMVFYPLCNNFLTSHLISSIFLSRLSNRSLFAKIVILFSSLGTNNCEFFSYVPCTSLF